MSMQLRSLDFINGGRIPPKLTCDGEGVSPTLEVAGIPESARTLALVLEDPDAPSGFFTHWVVWNIPAKAQRILSGSLPAGAVEGRNSAGRLGYIGPCPPSGTHNYIFTLYALDTELSELIPEKTDEKVLREKVAGHIIASSELVGLYSR